MQYASTDLLGSDETMGADGGSETAPPGAEPAGAEAAPPNSTVELSGRGL